MLRSRHVIKKGGALHSRFENNVETRQHLEKLNIYGLDDLLLSNKINEDFDEQSSTLQDMNSVTKQIQNDSTIWQTHAFFSTL